MENEISIHGTSECLFLVTHSATTSIVRRHTKGNFSQIIKTMEISMGCENFYVKCSIKSQCIDYSHENYFYLMGL